MKSAIRFNPANLICNTCFHSFNCFIVFSMLSDGPTQLKLLTCAFILNTVFRDNEKKMSKGRLTYPNSLGI